VFAHERIRAGCWSMPAGCWDGGCRWGCFLCGLPTAGGGRVPGSSALGKGGFGPRATGADVSPHPMLRAVPSAPSHVPSWIWGPAGERCRCLCPACPHSGASDGPGAVTGDFGGALGGAGDRGDPAAVGTGGCRAMSALWDVFPLSSPLGYVGQMESSWWDEQPGSALTSLPAASAGPGHRGFAPRLARVRRSADAGPAPRPAGMLRHGGCGPRRVQATGTHPAGTHRGSCPAGGPPGPHVGSGAARQEPPCTTSLFN